MRITNNKRHPRKADIHRPDKPRLQCYMIDLNICSIFHQLAMFVLNSFQEVYISNHSFNMRFRGFVDLSWSRTMLKIIFLLKKLGNTKKIIHFLKRHAWIDWVSEGDMREKNLQVLRFTFCLWNKEPHEDTHRETEAGKYNISAACPIDSQRQNHKTDLKVKNLPVAISTNCS